MAQIYYSDLQHFNDDLAAASMSLLSDLELQRYQQFKHAHAARTYLLGRYLCRMVMARLHNCEPAKFSMQPSGPTQFNENIAPWFINLSHSGDKCCCVVSDKGPCGIDVEQQSKARPFTRLVKHFYADSEQAMFQDLPKAALAQLFYQSWTLKEAFIKARGKTIAHHLNDLQLKIQAGRLALQTDLSIVKPWLFYQLELADYVFAWAAQDEDKQQLWQLNLVSQEFEVGIGKIQRI